MASSLAELPGRGRRVPELCDPAVREIFVDRYRLIFFVEDETVTILGFLHGARDFARWQRGDP